MVPGYSPEIRSVLQHREFVTKWKALEEQPRTKTAIKKLGREMGCKPVDCAFLDLDFHDALGVHGATPSELLHLM